MATFKIGFMSSTCPDFSMREVVSACQKYGFQSFDPRINWGHGHGIEPDAPASQIREARHMAEDAGVDIPCIATGISVAVPGGPERIAVIDEMKRVVDLCRLVGAPYMRIFGRGKDDLTEDVRVALASETLAEAAAALKGADVQVLLETHDRFRAARMVGRVLDEVDAPELAALWDTMHTVAVGESIEESFRLLGPKRIKHVHTRDLHLTRKEDGEIVSEYCDDYGKGNFPLREIDQLLAEAGFAGTLSLERIFKPGDPDHDADGFLRAHGAGMRSVHQAG